MNSSLNQLLLLLSTEQTDTENKQNYFKNLFEKYFLQQCQSSLTDKELVFQEDDDDLLFLVTLNHAEEYVLEVQRKPNLSKNINTDELLNKNILWETTLVLNLAIHLEYVLNVCIFKSKINDNEVEVPNILREMHASQVFALPSKSSTNLTSFEYTFPLIQFNLENQDEMLDKLEIIKDEYLCVELCAVLNKQSDDCLDAETEEGKTVKQVLTSKNNKDRVVLFQGGVSFVTLFEGFKEKLKYNKKINDEDSLFANLVIRESLQRGTAQMTIIANEIVLSESASRVLSQNNEGSVPLSENNSRIIESTESGEANNFVKEQDKAKNASLELINKIKALTTLTPSSTSSAIDKEEQKLKICLNNVSMNYESIYSELIKAHRKAQNNN